MKSLTTVMTAAALLSISAQAQALLIVSNYTLTYDAADGSLTIDPLGQPLYTYSIKTLGSLGGDDGFIEANHIPLPDDPGVFGTAVSTSTDDELSQSDFDQWTGLSPFNLGNVLPAGLTEAQFNSILDTSPQNTFYIDSLGSGQNQQNSYMSAFNVVFVPEPSSLVIIGLGAAMLAQRRRKR